MARPDSTAMTHAVVIERAAHRGVGLNRGVTTPLVHGLAWQRRERCGEAHRPDGLHAAAYPQGGAKCLGIGTTGNQTVPHAQ